MLNVVSRAPNSSLCRMRRCDFSPDRRRERSAPLAGTSRIEGWREQPARRGSRNILPSLRRLDINVDRERSPAVADFYAIAPQLQHLSIIPYLESVTPLLLECRNLRSLTMDCNYRNTIPDLARFDTPLLGIRVWEYEPESRRDLVELLAGAMGAGLLDERSMMVLPDVSSSASDKYHGGSVGLRQLGQISGARLQFADGELENK